MGDRALAKHKHMQAPMAWPGLVPIIYGGFFSCFSTNHARISCVRAAGVVAM